MKSYKQFINESKNSIESICKEYGIKNYTINPDGSIDVDGSIDFRSERITKLPLRFRNVSGNFWCHDSYLTTLEGCPEFIGGYFYCSNNQLTSLKGSPQNVGGDFYCFNNKITSLKGGPKNVGGDFDFSNNQLTSLEGCPEIGGDFSCAYNQLTSLEGCPQSVSISCQYNNIVDFRGISEFFENRLYCSGNPIWEIYLLFHNVKCIKWINEYDVIKDGNKVIMDRLEEVYHQLNMDIPKNIEFKSYEIV